MGKSSQPACDRVNIGKYSGTAGDSLGWHNGYMFSTYDQDNDAYSSINCAKDHKGGWWFHNCSYSNLNGYQYIGKYSDKYHSGIEWNSFYGSDYNSLLNTRMMFRPA